MCTWIAEGNVFALVEFVSPTNADLHEGEYHTPTRQCPIYGKGHENVKHRLRQLVSIDKRKCVCVCGAQTKMPRQHPTFVLTLSIDAGEEGGPVEWGLDVGVADSVIVHCVLFSRGQRRERRTTYAVNPLPPEHAERNAEAFWEFYYRFFEDKDEDDKGVHKLKEETNPHAIYTMSPSGDNFGFSNATIVGTAVSMLHESLKPREPPLTKAASRS